MRSIFDHMAGFPVHSYYLYFNTQAMGQGLGLVSGPQKNWTWTNHRDQK